MNKKELLGNLIDEKKAAVIKVLLDAKEELVLKEIAHKSKVPITSTFRILHELVRLGVIKRREWKTSKVYLKEQTETVTFLEELFAEEYDGIPDFIQGMQDLAGVQNIILHGGRKKNKANILLIGEGIDSGKVEALCATIRERGFEITHVPLTKEQYTQMSKMGLYAGEKVILR